MKKFALVCEGGTDQWFLEWLLHGIYEGQVNVNRLQPTQDETDKSRQGNFGGWENVLAFFERPNSVDEVFATNDYLIVQIDTDICEQQNFGVSKQASGQDKPVEQLVKDVREKLIEKMSEATFLRYQEQIAFAICVHSLECWILPLYAKKAADMTAIHTCEDRLHKALASMKQKYEKDPPFYRALCKPMRKKAGFDSCYGNSESFRVFVDSLPPKDALTGNSVAN